MSTSTTEAAVVAVSALRATSRADESRALIDELTTPGVELEPVDLRAAVARALALATPALRDRCGVLVHLGEVPAVVRATETRLAQIAVQLLDNAAEAIPPGNRIYNEVGLRVSVDERRVYLEVRDTGRGIPRHLIERVYDVGFTTKPTGAGLGLSLVRALVESFGGVLLLESTFGLGTHARVSLPRMDGPK